MSDEIRFNLEELAQRMGSMTTDAEAKRMCKLLKKRDILTFSELDDNISEHEFACLIAETVQP